MAITVTRKDGEAIISKVCERALIEAPGMGLHGAVVEIGKGGDAKTIDNAVTRAHQELATIRARIGIPVRGQKLPIVEPCRHTDTAAFWFDIGGKCPAEDRPHPFSQETLRKRYRRDKMLDDHNRNQDPLIRQLTHDDDGKEELFQLNLLDEKDLNWLAVIHADGNGLGAIFQDFLNVAKLGNTDAATYKATYSNFSDALDASCRLAATLALRDVWENDGKPENLFFRPLIVAGDDLTVVCEGKHGLLFAKCFLQHFANVTCANPEIKAVCGKHGLTAGAGIALVKAHHPFHRACDLAEELARTAKTLAKKVTPPVSALDFHVALDGALSTGDARMVEGRQEETHSSLRGGPYCIEDTEPQGMRSLKSLEQARDALAGDGLPRNQQHDLREAVVNGPYAANRALGLIRHRYPDTSQQAGGFDWNAIAPHGDLFDGGSTILLDALSLVQIARQSRGTS